MLSLAAAANAGVTVLGNPGLGTFTTIQSAVDAASHGDVLIATSGSYASFTIDDKALTVIGHGVVNVAGTCTVKNLATNHRAALIGLRITAPNVSSGTSSALVLQNDLGIVGVQDCTLKGGGNHDISSGAPSGNGATATNCQRVMIAASTLTGGSTGYSPGEWPRGGGCGLEAASSAVALYDCTLTGGLGSQETSPSGGEGGDACRVTGWGVFASGCTLTGGWGGSGDYIGTTTQGDGGDGLQVTSGQAKLLDCTLVAGKHATFPPFIVGVDGQPLNATSAIVKQYAGAKRTLAAMPIVNDKSVFSLTVTGTPGDRVWLLQDLQPTYLPIGPFIGVATIALPWKLLLQPANVIGPSGSLTINLPISDYTGPSAGWMWHLQGLCIDASGKRYLTTPRAVLVLDT
ncbi:MAG: hypothetical protein K8S98_17215 [Planctomycetes bacterium]|nr:hypothetical protein [Planctomycetota bacterium]